MTSPISGVPLIVAMEVERTPQGSIIVRNEGVVIERTDSGRLRPWRLESIPEVEADNTTPHLRARNLFETEVNDEPWGPEGIEDDVVTHAPEINNEPWGPEGNEGDLVTHTPEFNNEPWGPEGIEGDGVSHAPEFNNEHGDAKQRQTVVIKTLGFIFLSTLPALHK